MVKTKKTFIYYRESAIQSIVADIFTFGLIFTGFLFNRFVLYGRWYIDLFFIFLFFVSITSKTTKKAKVFTSIKDLKDYINKL